MKKPLFTTFGCLGAAGVLYLLVQLFKIVSTSDKAGLFFCVVTAYALIVAFLTIMIMLMVDFGGAKDD